MARRLPIAFPRPTGLIALAAVLLGLLTPGCSDAAAPPAPAEPMVLVEVAPLVSLVRPLVGEGVEVVPIVPAGVSPHGYQLTPADARRLARASMVITVGPVLEPAITRAVARQTPAERVFSIADAVGVEAGDDHHHHGHDHSEDEGDTCVHGVDPHLWLDPVLVGTLVDALPEALRAHGVASDDADGVAATLRAEIDGIHAAYESGLSPFAGRAIITHHDAFRRVADRYGLAVAQVIRPVSGVEPTPGDLSRVSEAVAAAGVGAIFVEPQFPDALPRRIAERLGLAVFTLDPEGSDDWAAMMRSNLEALIAGLSAKPGSRGEPAAAEESDG